MDIFGNVVMNFILIMFPMLFYFVFHCYRELCMEKYSNLLFDVSLVSSMYLCLKFGNVGENIFVLLFCNVPIVLAYLKRRVWVGIFLSLGVIFYIYFYTNYGVFLVIIKFLCYFAIYMIGRVRKIKDYTFVMSIVVLQGFFLSFYYFSFVRKYYVGSFISLFLVMLVFYLLPFFLLFLFGLGDRISLLYVTVNELEKDKQFKNSLFKITHEVKNPIAVCKGYLDMMDVHDVYQVERYVPIIREEIDRSLNIMSDFMEFSKIKIDKEVMDINLLLEEIVDEFSVLFIHKKIAMDCHIISDEVYVDGDYNRLKQVFVNLLKNGLEAIDGSGKIQILTHILKEKYYIEIIDDGVGMDDDTLDKIKDMFYTTKVNGNGLGVSLSDEIIKAHGGSIDYFSKVGHGTRVVVKLPIAMV